MLADVFFVPLIFLLLNFIILVAFQTFDLEGINDKCILNTKYDSYRNQYHLCLVYHFPIKGDVANGIRIKKSNYFSSSITEPVETNGGVVGIVVVVVALNI